ncbi:MAG: hypothetical protein B5M56_11135 [Desulfococcus sp. 4484_241]|nr:MAG: hypothetical protein B5M56_11135 [Desulfococcus sp. 4484_241]
MDIKCNKCGAGFKVPDSKLPKGKSVSVRCPSCKGKMHSDLPKVPILMTGVLMTHLRNRLTS